ncbi:MULTISPECIES: response regulator [unclassified Rhizobium]|uniref:response regulator n=1 Tax=unclassified Rhizobium TaxID=2613769 RepID=UPI00116097D7|nr:MULTISPECIES: response regulator [unclassified Rhizobium]TQX85782.1 response regulator [Rhizobium sp. rho-13.1]TQY10535.1 response regulator [Rhizobium sp. rho-1.1]
MPGDLISKIHILVVDDDPRICQMLQRYFEEEGYGVTVAHDGKSMKRAMTTMAFDAILLDLVLPGDDGLTLARDIRAGSDIPIIMLTGRDDVIDRIVGLEIGADDYIAKPFHLREVLARVRTILRRRRAMPAAPVEVRELIRFDGFTLDIDRRVLSSSDHANIELTTGEFDMLAVLARSPRRVLTRQALMDMTRGRNLEAFDRTIDAQIARLRKKIERDPKKPEIIKSVRGIGYVFSGRDDSSE